MLSLQTKNHAEVRVILTKDDSDKPHSHSNSPWTEVWETKGSREISVKAR